MRFTPEQIAAAKSVMAGDGFTPDGTLVQMLESIDKWKQTIEACVYSGRISNRRRCRSGGGPVNNIEDGPSHLMSIDPGKHEHAMAHFAYETLELVTMAEDPMQVVCGLERVVIERMRIYPGYTSPKDPNDLLDVATAAGVLAGRLTQRFPGLNVQWSYAADWKGQTPKPISHRRIWAALSEAERQVLAAAIGKTPAAVHVKIRSACHRLATTGKVTGYKWKAHNLLDAVGIGLHALGRL